MTCHLGRDPVRAVLQKVIADVERALACIRCGQADKARETLQQILAEAPPSEEKKNG